MAMLYNARALEKPIQMSVPEAHLELLQLHGITAFVPAPILALHST